MKTYEAEIGFSGDFGGTDADARLAPHWLALNAACKGKNVRHFPFKEIGFILRGDGDVHSFGFEGLAHHDLHKKFDYLSVDIGIPVERQDDPKPLIIQCLTYAGAYIFDLLYKYDSELEENYLIEFESQMKQICEAYANTDV